MEIGIAERPGISREAVVARVKIARTGTWSEEGWALIDLLEAVARDRDETRAALDSLSRRFSIHVPAETQWWTEIKISSGPVL